MSKYLLIKYNRNWADEFDLEGFLVMTKPEWEEYKNKVATVFDKAPSGKDYSGALVKQVEVGFGTNEDVCYSSVEDYFRSFKEVEISLKEYNFLKQHFKGWKYISNGVMALIDDFDDYEDEDESEDENE